MLGRQTTNKGSGKESLINTNVDQQEEVEETK